MRNKVYDMNKIKINSLTEFVDHIDKKCNSDLCMFRGQSEPWPLLPRIARITARTKLLKDEKAMLSDFKRHILEFATRPPKDDWEYLSLAQHHGMATRLLDWTSNPLAALWFAVQAPRKDVGNGVVYWIELQKEDLRAEANNPSPFGNGKTLFFAPNVVGSRIRVQGAYFSAHKRSDNDWIPLEKNQKFKNGITALEIPSGMFASLRYSLDRCGINKSTLFPDLDGLCSHLTWIHSVAEDEKSSSEAKPDAKQRNRK